MWRRDDADFTPSKQDVEIGELPISGPSNEDSRFVRR